MREKAAVSRSRVDQGASFWKRAVSVWVAFALAFTLVPLPAYAEDGAVVARAEQTMLDEEGTTHDPMTDMQDPSSTDTSDDTPDADEEASSDSGDDKGAQDTPAEDPEDTPLAPESPEEGTADANNTDSDALVEGEQEATRAEEDPDATLEALAATATESMYRLYNPNSGEHFYTANAVERATVRNAGWTDEGYAWTAPVRSSTPVFRLYSGTDHHYTMSSAERDALQAAGWSYEGIGWYSDDAKGVPLYRQYNPNVVPTAPFNNSGSHNYTISIDEHRSLVSIGWHDEGISWYGCKSGNAPTTPSKPTPTPTPVEDKIATPEFDIFSATTNEITFSVDPDYNHAVTYTFEVYADAAMKSRLKTESGCNELYTATGLAPSTDYYVRVKAVGDSKESPWTALEKFSTKDTVAAANSYKIRYNANYSGASYPAVTQVAERNYYETIKENPFERDGHSFVSWNTKADGTGTDYYRNAFVWNLAAVGSTLDLYAVWHETPTSYTVEFRANSGSGYMPAQAIERDELTDLSANTFKRTNHVFKGWGLTTGGTEVTYKDGESVYNIADAGESLILYARWQYVAPQYTVKYDANSTDGTVTFKGAQGARIPDQIVSTNDTTTSVTLISEKYENTKYDFTGWNTRPDGTGTSYASGASVKHLASAGDTVTLYAQWKLKTYTIHFDANGGTGSMPDMVLGVYEERSLDLNKFTRANHTFKYWAENPSGTSGICYDGRNMIHAAEAGETLTLYACWDENAYTVSFDPNGGTVSGDRYHTQKVFRNTYTKLDACTYTKTGYVFIGWNTARDGKGASYSDQAYVYNLASNATVYLYAQWAYASQTYTVQFYPNGGSGSMRPQTMTVGSWESLQSNAFTRTGYRFKNWNTQAGGGGVAYSNGQSVKDIGSAGGTVALYAQWESGTQNYTVRFNANGGSGTMYSSTFTRDVTTTLPTNTFTRANYTFTGWSTNSSGTGSTYVDRATVKNLASAGGSITLYAQWTAVKGSVTTSTGDQIYVKPDGTKLTGWQKVSVDKYRYYDANGVMVKNKEFNVTTKDSTMGAVGNATGVRGFDENGYLIFGWGFWVNGAPTKYFDTNTGVRKTGEFYMTMFNKTTKDGNPGWRYCNASGTLMYGWQTIGSSVKYFDAAGARLHGQHYIEFNEPKAKTGSYNAWCFFTGDGSSSNQSGGARSYGLTTMKQNGVSIQKYYDENGKRAVGQKYLTYSNPKTKTGAFNAWVYLKGSNTKTDMNGGVLAKGWEGVPQSDGTTAVKYFDTNGKRLVGKQTVLYDWLDDSTRVNDPAPGRVLLDGSNASTSATGGVLHKGFSGGTYYHWDNGKETQHNTWKNAYSTAQPFARDPDEKWSADQLFTRYMSYRASNGKTQPNGMSSLDLSAESACYNLYIADAGVGKNTYKVPSGCQVVAGSSTTQPFHNGYDVITRLPAGDKSKVLIQYVDGVATSVLKAPGGKWYFAIVYKIGSAPKPPASANAMNSEERALAVQIFNQYNAFRASKGLRTVNWNEGYVKDAFEDAKWIAAKGELIHAGRPGGLKNQDGQYKDQGWQQNFSDILQFSTWKMSPQEVVQRWSQSSGHRKMMQCDSATDAAVGVYNNGGTWYYVIVYNFKGRNQSGS